jgi:hypothetical protein
VIVGFLLAAGCGGLEERGVVVANRSGSVVEDVVLAVGAEEHALSSLAAGGEGRIAFAARGGQPMVLHFALGGERFALRCDEIAGRSESSLVILSAGRQVLLDLEGQAARIKMTEQVAAPGEGPSG